MTDFLYGIALERPAASQPSTLTWDIMTQLTPASPLTKALHTILDLEFAVAFAFIYRLLWMLASQRRFAQCGPGTTVFPGEFTFKNVYLGRGVVIGYRCRFSAVHSRIVIRDRAGIAAECVIRTGDHNTSCIGRYMMDFTEAEKRPGDDRDVTIEEDVWVGTRCIILKGANIHRGAVVGAGSVIRGFVPPYSVVAGNPARVYRFRADVDSIVRHEEKLYPPEARLCPRALQQYQARYPNLYSTC
jgi:acetyltransferase-like isoleucine patch superfamily enzyme